MEWTRKLGALSIAAAFLLTSSCWSDTEADELPIVEDSVTTASELERETEEYAETRKDNVKNRVNQLVETVQLRLDSITRWESAENISGDARLRSEKLREDLERLQEKLQSSLDSLKEANASEERIDQLKARLEQTEDELDQIKEEMNEWYDRNLK